MTEEQQAPNPSVEPDTASAPPPEASAPGGTEPPAAPSADKELAEGKAFAILSYALNFIGIPFFLVPLIMRNNAFALYHSKQCLMIWLSGIAVSVAAGILTVICIGPFLGLAGAILLLVLNIVGLLNAIHEKQEALPLIGKWGVDWFAGITKV